MISIINYGLGNINAITSAYDSIGVKYLVVNKPDDLEDATHIILPGVGSFDNAMKKIIENDFRDILDKLVLEKKVNILGICVGLQIMSDSSKEGNQKGFGWIKTEAEIIKIKNNNYKVPHMGWNKIELSKDCPVLEGVKDQEFYFLHSYNINDNSDKYKSAVSIYGSLITAAISYKNIYGVQFHPEKSHTQGLRVLKNFSELK